MRRFAATISVSTTGEPAWWWWITESDVHEIPGTGGRLVEIVGDRVTECLTRRHQSRAEALKQAREDIVRLMIAAPAAIERLDGEIAREDGGQ